MNDYSIVPRKGGGWVLKHGRQLIAGPFDSFKEAARALSRQCSLTTEEFKIEGRAKWPTIENVPISVREQTGADAEKPLDRLIEQMKPAPASHRNKQKRIERIATQRVPFVTAKPGRKAMPVIVLGEDNKRAEKRQLYDMLGEALANTGGRRV